MWRSKLALIVVASTALVAVHACRTDAPGRGHVEGSTRFTLLPPAFTGIDFENRLTDTEAFNVFTYRNYYNGGGVGIGDVNGDGLPDIYLAANQGPNRLYLNRGDFSFVDITYAAGVAGERAWSTGVSFVDINGDGLLDIYVCNAGNVDGDDKANELFVNNGVGADGIPTFTEMAEAYGLADEGYSTHAAFFDYDGDGDLDLYLLNNSFRPVSSFGLRNIRHVRNDHGGDKLYRNENGSFVDVSEEAGVYGSEIGFGLGVTVGDVNRDGWLDIYISNDFFERDYLYLNRGDGTFEEVLEEQMRYVSLSSMGADMADLDNDGYPEIYVTDMLPEDDRRLKTTSSYESWDVYSAKLKNGYYHQYMRNMLHLNNADGTFSEIGQFAGVSATDWSWSALMADFDNDGRRDIFVTNGILRDVTHQDFIDFFAGELNLAASSGGKRLRFMRLLEEIPSEPLPNYMFRNQGSLSFTNEAAAWGLATPSFSNGAAYADLDADGDLDLVVNNVNQPVFVYRNETDRMDDHRFLRIRMEGEAPNTMGIGAHAALYAGAHRWYAEQIPYRGFQSSVDPVLTIGLGETAALDSVEVVWPDGRMQVFRDVPAGETLVARQSDAEAARTEGIRGDTQAAPLLADVTAAMNLGHRHEENPFIDFDRERLIPKMLSREGPHVEVGDVDGDGRDDFFIGGAKGTAGAVFLQLADGSFRRQDAPALEADAVSEDVGALFVDVDGDGDLDLYVVSGGTEYSDMAPALRDRLYLNDGQGRFAKSEGRLPSLYASGSRVVAADFDADGDLDLFVGGRAVPWRYGEDPRSVLLENDGRGYFTDVTEKFAPDLATVGMVTDALWHDLDGDGLPELVVVGEWMPITIFENRGGRSLVRADAPGLEKSHGWWNRIVAGDFDGDGDVEFVVGNLGRNVKIQASADEPATMHVGDFDRNGSVEQIVSYYKDGASLPMVLRHDLVTQLPSLKKKYLKYAAYAGNAVSDILSEEQLTDTIVRYAHTMSSAIVRRQGDAFEVVPLPDRVQFAPIYGILARDVDGDGNLDLLLAGNFYGFRPDIGRLDANYGLLLLGDGSGDFRVLPPSESGFIVRGEVRDLQLIDIRGRGSLVVAARNDDAPLFFRLSDTGR